MKTSLRLSGTQKHILKLLKLGCVVEFVTKGIMPRDNERVWIKSYPYLTEKHPELKHLLFSISRKTFTKFLKLGIIRLDFIDPETHVYSSRFLTKKSIEKINSLHSGLDLKWRLENNETI